MKTFPERFGAATEEPRQLGEGEVESKDAQSDIKYPDTSSESNRASCSESL